MKFLGLKEHHMTTGDVYEKLATSTQQLNESFNVVYRSRTAVKCTEKKNKKRTCKACKTAIFSVLTFVTFLLTSLWWLYEQQTNTNGVIDF